MILSKIKNIPIILGSQSPRRRELLHSLGLDFEVVIKSIDESLPNGILPKDAAEYVASKKLDAFSNVEFHNHLIITADTVVVDIQGEVLGKPISLDDAKNTLQKLSANTHQVFTGVAVQLNNDRWSFTSMTEVVFDKLTMEEIDFYVDTYQPLDKAGAYGIQEWIGKIGVLSINGSYENVIGLPTNCLYKTLKEIEKGL